MIGEEAVFHHVAAPAVGAIERKCEEQDVGDADDGCFAEEQPCEEGERERDLEKASHLRQQ